MRNELSHTAGINTVHSVGFISAEAIKWLFAWSWILQVPYNILLRLVRVRCIGGDLDRGLGGRSRYRRKKIFCRPLPPNV